MSVDNARVEAIKDKLRKLIAKEASARELGNLAEAEAFANKIQELMIDYELEMDDVMGGAAQRVHAIGEENFDCGPLTQRHESNWVAALYLSCAQAAFCKAVFMSMKGEAAPDTIKIFGDPTNRELLHYMVAQLVVKLRQLSRRAFSEYNGDSKRNTFIRSFYKGANIGIRERLLEEKAKAEAANQQVYGLVINKRAAIEKYLQDKGYRFRQSSGTRSSSTDGYQAGKEAGRSVSLNKGVGGQGSSKKYLG